MQLAFDLPKDFFRLVRIDGRDVTTRSDDLLLFRQRVLDNEDSYPGISRWLDDKVLHGIKSGQRTGFIGLLNERPVAAAIVKRGQTSKFCHLKLEPDARSKSLGDLFFVLMTLELRRTATSVHFTLPESLWTEKASFFQSFSFAEATRAHRQYRLFDTELYCETSFSSLFESSRQKLSGILGKFIIGNHSLLTGAVMALHPEPLQKILSGEKTVEIRSRFSKQWEGQRISLYATRPHSSIAGEARVGRVVKNHPNHIWELFGHCVGCTRSEYDAYVAGHEEVFAILLDDVQAYREEIPLAQLSHLLGLNLPAPQSYLSLANNDGWLSAVALSAALQGSLSMTAAQSSKMGAHSSP
jgi:predicted transcriptional regulator